MAAWLVRAGKQGQDEDAAIEKGLAIIGWHEMPDVSEVPSYEAMKKKQAEVYPNMSPKAVINNAAQIWAFAKRIKKGDMAILPLKTRSVVALGRFTGDYEHRHGRHVRPVEWIRQDVPRSDVGQDLLYSLGAFMTVCQIARNNAEQRLEAMLNGATDPNLKGKPVSTAVEDGASPDEEGMIDIEEQALDQIRRVIESKFKAHNLTRLVESILGVQGCQTYRSPEGPDGGVDILAGHGPMGFDEPRICVQVKSGGVQGDSAVRELEGVMSRMNAEKGLFVSWDGFTKAAFDHVKDLFFKVRLWDDKKLMAALLADYDRLPDEIQAELPLKRIWVVVPEEGE